MAADQSRFQYSAMSTLVLQADRRGMARRQDEPTGAPETLVGRIDPKAMGDRALRTKADVDTRRKKAAANGTAEVVSREPARRRAAGVRGAHADVLAAADDLEGISYRPRTRETREVFDVLLGAVHTVLGDQPQDVVRSAADYVLEQLKDERLKDVDRKRAIENLVGSITAQNFAELIALGKKITDYGDDDEGAKAGADVDADAAIDEDGVAVVFDEEEAEDEMDADDDGGAFEVRDEDDDSEIEADPVDGPAPEARDEGAEEQLVIGGGATSSRKADKLGARDIDAYWLQRLVAQSYPEAQDAAERANRALALLGGEGTTRDVENALMELFDYDKFELVRTLVQDRELIFWCTQLMRADEDERVNLEVAMREKGVGWILRELSGKSGAKAEPTNGMDVDAPVTAKSERAAVAKVEPRSVVDIDSMVFQQGGRLMSNKKCRLPEGSFKRTKKGYEEVHVPAPTRAPLAPGDLKPITELPAWARPAFGSATSLNRVQSKVFPTAFERDDPMLLCAPTGAGKTNVAMLTILRELGKYRDEATGAIALDAFKIVYIAPMKALVQEMVGNFGSRLQPYGVRVSELTGDRQLTKEQIAETQIIVTTPEKWDVITRKSSDTSYTNLVRLIIIDEIHLLHDDRGPVLEAVIARTIRRAEQTQDDVRLVGLSATLPNYKDVAKFLRVDPAIGLFHFDASVRPCPLKQQFIGVTEKRAIMRHQVMNEVCYEKVLEHAGTDQVLVFVHSRKETAKTAKAMRDMALEQGTITSFLRADGAAKEILETEAANVSDGNLKDLLPFGFAIHHAGMTRVDRTLVEELFADGHIQVLVSTATLAWGVNLPAHAVVIKGTQIYNPEKGRWVELSPQDVLQMLGRAGRPQFDTFGEGIIITNHSELQYYLSMMNQQLPIESQLAKKLADNLNAEIVLGTVRSRDEAVSWLGYTYYYTRLLGSPVLYGVSADYRDDDPRLIQFRADLIHAAAVTLEKAGLVKYQRKSGALQSTELGRIASHYYITARSMTTYNQQLRPSSGLIELLRTFSLSEEFTFIPVREEEKGELLKLLDRVPIPVKESVEEPAAKINVLLQAYISNLRLDGFALVSDMVYVTASAGRILRAVFEICLKRGWAALTHQALDLCKMVERRIWPSMSPLRQFRGVPLEVVRKAERKEFPWYRYFDLDAPQLGELIGLPKAGRLVHRLVHQFPKLELSATVVPITRSLLRIELTITPDFEWDDKVHGSTEAFWVMAEDVDGELVLFHDQFLLRQRFSQQDHYVTFTVPILDPQPPNYFITVVSDRWLHAQTRLPVSFQHLILPDKFPPPTTLLELQPLPVSALRNAEYEAIYSEQLGAGAPFNKIQTQVFQALYTTGDNVFVGAPAGSGKTICAEFALLRLWSQPGGGGRCVCICPYAETVELRVAEWATKFAAVKGGKTVVGLTGDTVADLRLLNESDVVVCTPAQWDVLSRRWKQRKAVAEVALFIADELHLIGSAIGATYEVAISRARFVSAQQKTPSRIVGLGVSLANARDVGEWIGAPAQAVFNFSPGARPVPLEVHVQSFNVPHFPSLMIQMARPTFLAITEWAVDRSSLVFVPSRRQCALTANDLVAYVLADDEPDRFLNVDRAELAPHLEHVSDRALRDTLEHGIGFYHEGLSKQDKRIVERLYTAGAIQVVVASKDVAWSIPLTAYLVVLAGVQVFEGKEHRYVDYSFVDVLQIMGRACRPGVDESSRCVLMVPQVRKQYFLKFVQEGLPIESSLHLGLAEHFNAEIVSKTINTKHDALDWLTWTFLYRRLAANCNFYGMAGNSHQHISDHLSELVENTCQELSQAKLIEVEGAEEMDLAALNLGMIAAYYDVRFMTCDVFSLSLTDKTKLKGLLEIVSSAAEFESVPVRHREDLQLRKLYDRLPVKLSEVDYSSPHFKVNVLLQAHFSRLVLPADLALDQERILGQVLKLLSAVVDVLSSGGHVNALSAMDLSQMVVQACWNSASPLKQIPHFTDEIIERCKARGVESVYDLLDLEDDDRTQLLGLSAREMRAVATFANRYPSLAETVYEVQDATELNASTPISVKVTLERELDDDDDGEADIDTTVVAPLYPLKKQEGWWVVLSEPSTRTLLAIKKIQLQRKHTASLDFSLPEGKHDLTIAVISDSYMGCDREHALTVNVAAGEPSDDEDDEDAMSE